MATEPTRLETHASTSTVVQPTTEANSLTSEGLATSPDPILSRPKPPESSWLSKWYGWLTVLVSLGLHAAVFLFPLGDKPQPKPPEKAEQQIRITQLPSLNKKLPQKKVPERPKVTRTVTRPRPAAAPPPPPVKPSSPAPDSAAPRAADPVTGDNEPNPWDDFPLYPGSQPGCFELPSCLEVEGTLSQVSDHFVKELPAKKYEIKPTVQEAERIVYQVSRNGQTQFLSILQNGKNTVYVLSNAARTLDDLESAVEVPPEVYSILLGLAVQQADPSHFAQPNQFYAKPDGKGLKASGLAPRSEVRNISLVSGQPAETMMDEFFRSNLVKDDFEVTDLPTPYGGGNVYQIQKENTSLYLNMVPTKDGTGTLIVIWKELPK